MLAESHGGRCLSERGGWLIQTASDTIRTKIEWNALPNEQPGVTRQLQLRRRALMALIPITLPGLGASTKVGPKLLILYD